MMRPVSRLEKALYDQLDRHGPTLLTELLASLARELDSTPEQLQSVVMAAATRAQEQGLLRLSSRERTELTLVADPETLRAGLPERRALALVGSAAGDGLDSRELSRRAAELAIPVHEVIRWGTERGWYEKVKLPDPADPAARTSGLALTAKGELARSARDADEGLVERLIGSNRLYLDEVEGLDPEDPGVRLLCRRSSLVKVKTRSERTLELTEAGRAVARGPLKVRASVSQYGRAEIEGWRDVEFRPYDVTLQAATVHPVKSHPLERILQEARRAFLEMGFEEVVSPMVESAFWDFDALFQPQDHPAREMQDTFYCSSPARARLPAPELVERVCRTHETGGETGSTGWGYRWDAARAEQVVLRTHTTAATVRALAANPNPPRKVFVVGRVFRNETVSATKLPEFHQVDGIIIDEDASFATLLGTLKVFYAKMGFEKVRFKPAFFPYTEPSAEVYVYFDRLGRWVEMGGSGMFRPEVTIPMGSRVPVLAWGLGLERLAMFRYQLGDIRALYQADLDWIRGVPLCR